MVETTYQCRLIGEGIKPPKGALINSLGAERLGESSPKRLAGMNKGVERK